MLAGAVVLCSGAAANAVTFGTPIGVGAFNAAPNNPYSCSVYLTLIGPTEVFGPFGGPATSCIWIHIPTPAEEALFPRRNITLAPPLGRGIVTRVRVAVGPTTGPMRVIVMRSLYRNTGRAGHPEDACCFPVARSRVFTPARNRITAVSVRLPTRVDPTPRPNDTRTIADEDVLGLAVLAPGVPVPLYYTGTLSAPVDLLWNTANPSTVTPGFYTDTGGFFVALNADWRRRR